MVAEQKKFPFHSHIWKTKKIRKTWTLCDGLPDDNDGSPSHEAYQMGSYIVLATSFSLFMEVFPNEIQSLLNYWNLLAWTPIPFNHGCQHCFNSDLAENKFTCSNLCFFVALNCWATSHACALRNHYTWNASCAFNNHASNVLEFGFKKHKPELFFLST